MTADLSTLLAERDDLAAKLKRALQDVAAWKSTSDHVAQDKIELAEEIVKLRRELNASKFKLEP